MRLDPLHKLEESRSRALIPEKVYARVMERYRYVTEGIERVERASGIEYPEYYIEPSMVVADAQYSLGLMFARTIPVVKGMYGSIYDHTCSDGESRLSIVVQVTAPLVAYGLKGTIHAILAHEFLHYIELLARFINMNVISDEVSNSIFESVYADMSRVVEPRIAFRKDRALIRLVARKFQDGLSDHRLEEKCMKDWIEKGLPTVRMSVEENIARIPIEAIASFSIDDGLRNKIYEFISASSSSSRRRVGNSSSRSGRGSIRDGIHGDGEGRQEGEG
ncbi:MULTISPECIES: hypothetical protein [Candidatus Nitrosocaldus]|jgi:hypothetical protein|uniref:Uncharacterized protein n=1 Tax=Candidatus Nitrosocaldus cavascurensis TaxID=2058097 RepID=A0A2K5AS10_9ARCH|nr:MULTISPECIES: hypothetical protein [Candidatus Nitrosocaldus]SPC34384.1 conserved protein of unknown function [Candidatus Nitrosocaldus cavascurensis]